VFSTVKWFVVLGMTRAALDNDVHFLHSMKVPL